MLLNRDQAESVYSTICEMNKWGARVDITINLPEGETIRIENVGGSLTIVKRICGRRIPNDEEYDSRWDFAEAYGII